MTFGEKRIGSNPVDQVMANLHSQRAVLQSVDDEFASISARVMSRDRLVSVEVDGLGALTGLWLDERAYRHGADGLARLIVALARSADDVVGLRRRELLDRLGGSRYPRTDSNAPTSNTPEGSRRSERSQGF